MRPCAPDNSIGSSELISMGIPAFIALITFCSVMGGTSLGWKRGFGRGLAGFFPATLLTLVFLWLAFLLNSGLFGGSALELAR